MATVSGLITERQNVLSNGWQSFLGRPLHSSIGQSSAFWLSVLSRPAAPPSSSALSSCTPKHLPHASRRSISMPELCEIVFEHLRRASLRTRFSNRTLGRP
jgi:hypothetical protein